MANSKNGNKTNTQNDVTEEEQSRFPPGIKQQGISLNGTSYLQTDGKT